METIKTGKKISDECNPEFLVYAIVERAVSDFTILQDGGALRRGRALPWPKDKNGAPRKVGSMMPPENLQLLHFFEQGGGLDALLRIMQSGISADAVRDRLFSGDYECMVDVEEASVDGETVYVGAVVTIGKHTRGHKSNPAGSSSDARWAANRLATAAGYQIVPRNIIEADKKGE